MLSVELSSLSCVFLCNCSLITLLIKMPTSFDTTSLWKVETFISLAFCKMVFHVSCFVSSPSQQHNKTGCSCYGTSLSILKWGAPTILPHEFQPSYQPREAISDLAVFHPLPSFFPPCLNSALTHFWSRQVQCTLRNLGHAFVHCGAVQNCNLKLPLALSLFYFA